MEKKAIAYTADIVLANTGWVIEREFQKKRIEEYAKENNIKIVAWFEEEAYHENPFLRPKLQELIGYTEPYDMVLVERTWAISRRFREIKGLMKLVENKKAKVEATTRLWDCVSQMARHYYHRGTPMPACALAAREGAPTSINLVETYGRFAARNAVKPNQAYKVRRPAQLAFANLT
jgi:hypothetical protein